MPRIVTIGKAPCHERLLTQDTRVLQGYMALLLLQLASLALIATPAQVGEATVPPAASLVRFASTQFCMRVADQNLKAD